MPNAVSNAAAHNPATTFLGQRIKTVSTDSSLKAAIRESHRTWITELTKRLDLSPSDLARKAGASDVTLTRLLNDRTYQGTLSAMTIAKIKAFSGLPGPGETMPAMTRRRGDAVPFEPSATPTPSDRAVLSALAELRNAKAFQLVTDTLRPLGHFAGDILIADPSETQLAGDLVAAVSKGQPGQQDEILIRFIKPPYLLGLPADPATGGPLPIDNAQIIVLGKIIVSIRGAAPPQS